MLHLSSGFLLDLFKFPLTFACACTLYNLTISDHFLTKEPMNSGLISRVFSPTHQTVSWLFRLQVVYW